MFQSTLNKKMHPFTFNPLQSNKYQKKPKWSKHYYSMEFFILASTGDLLLFSFLASSPTSLLPGATFTQHMFNSEHSPLFNNHLFIHFIYISKSL